MTRQNNKKLSTEGFSVLLQKILKNEQILFLVVGGFNTVFGLVVFYLFEWTLQPVLGYFLPFLLSYFVMTVISFVLYRTIVFKVKGKVLTDFVRFVSVYLVPFFANLTLLPLMVSGLKINVYLAQTLIVVASAVFSYVGHKYFSFRRK